MNYYEKKQFTDDELIIRVMDKEEIKKVLARRAFYYANNQRRRELDELWVQTPEYQATASYGRNWGYYVGMDSIEQYYVIDHTEKQYAALEAIHKNNLDVAVDSANLGYGCTAFHTVTTPMLYIAGDGKTARGLWYLAGQETIMQADGTAKAYHTMDNMGVELVKENGQWRIWHLVVCNDFIVEAGTDFKTGSLEPLTEEDPFREEFGTPDIPMVVHNPRYNLTDNYPPMPQPYDTYTAEGSLGPEGHPGLPEGYYKFMKEGSQV